MESHGRVVEVIATKVRSFYDREAPFRIYHGSTNSTRQSDRQRDQMIDTSKLTKVLKIDQDSKTALVEPNVPMDDLVAATLPYGLIPLVVMEFPGITVGGGFAGTAGESSSFRYGFFDRTVNWIEIVLANGEVVRASDSENSDLFYGAASSFGTLGITTLLEVQLMPSQPYVALTYVPVTGIEHAQEEIQRATSDLDVDFVDGIMFSERSGVICVGRLSSEASTPIQGFCGRSDPWFYIHVERLMANKTSMVTESIPITDYFFRYDRGGFWVAKYAFRYFLTPFNRITRFILDYCMHTRVMYHALHASNLASQYILQDVAIPYAHTAEFARYLAANFRHYPLWLCPLKQSGTLPSATHTLKTRKTNHATPETMLNFGVWGPGPTDRGEFVRWNRQFEGKVHELGGQKWLYARTYYTEEEFDEIYNRTEYEALREKYHAGHLPTVYDKVKVNLSGEERAARDTWSAWAKSIFWRTRPLPGLYGVYKALLGGDYLLSKRSRGGKAGSGKDL